VEDQNQPVYRSLIAWGVVLLIIGAVLTAVGFLGVDAGVSFGLSYPFVGLGALIFHAGLIGYAVNGSRVSR
jgi:hypothetical protein